MIATSNSESLRVQTERRRLFTNYPECPDSIFPVILQKHALSEKSNFWEPRHPFFWPVPQTANCWQKLEAKMTPLEWGKSLCSFGNDLVNLQAFGKAALG